LRGYLEAGNKKRKGVAADVGASVEAGGLQRTVGTPCADTHPGAYSGQDAYTGRLIPSHWEGGNVHPTLNQSAKGSGGVGSSNQELFSQGGAYLVPGQPIPIQDGREMEKNQNGMGVGQAGDPAYTIDTTGAQAAAIPFRKSKQACSTTDNETWVPADASNTLNNFDLGDTRTTHAVVQPQVYENHPNDSRVTGPLDVAPTVVSRFGTGGGNVPLVNNEAITFQPGNLRREAGADPSTTTTTLKASAGDQTPHVAYHVAGFKWHQGAQAGSVGYEEGVCPTITSVKEPAVIHPVVPLDGMNLLSRLGPCGEEHSLQNFEPGDPSFTLKKGGNQHGVLTPMAVRRLTPTECLRLQGFPDGWSQIPWKGKPASECPDGPQYKAAGNSMAVPVMRWIGERIAAVDSTISTNA
jgi:site-specific DNA-cytosine methylase